MRKVTICVPASTSNLGPGFDCLGVALRIYNFVTLTRLAPRKPPPLMVRAAARLFFKSVRQSPFPFACTVRGDIPPARGLGSSAALRAGVLCGLNQLAGRPLHTLSLFQLCSELEEHPDNAAPAVLGGFNVVRGGFAQTFRVESQLKFVVLVPDLEVRTVRARDLLPSTLQRAKAVESSRNACAITAAFASRKYRNLRGAFVDHLHQPFRVKMVPFLPGAIAVAEKAGALGAFLSGSGSAICAVTLGNAERIAEALRAIDNIRARTIITTADNTGARIKLQTSNPPKDGFAVANIKHSRGPQS